MKLLFSSDWHLGKYVASYSMLEEQRWFIDNVYFPAIERHEPDALVIAGDIYDRAVAPTAAIALFDDFLTRVAELGIPLIAISGNHDGAERMSIGTRIMRSSGIYIFTDASRPEETVSVRGRDGVTAVFHPLPYFDPSMARAVTGDEDAREYSELFRKVIGRMDISDRSVRHVLISHCTVIGSTFSDSESGVMVGGSSEIDPACLSGFDAVLLGHLHSAQQPVSNAAYSGSPLRYSFSSSEHDKKLMLVSLGETTAFEPLPIVPRREMRTLTGTFDHLMSGDVPASDDFISAELTDSQFIYEPMSRLREKFPNILGVRYSEYVDFDGDQPDRSELRSRLRSRTIGDRDVFCAFLKQMCGTEPEDADLEHFDSLCAQVNAEEADELAP